MSKYNRWKGVFDSASLTGSFQNLGTVIDFPVLKVAIMNASDVACLITDGSSEDDFEIPANGTVNIGEGEISGTGTGTKFVFDKSTQLQVKQKTAAGTGNIIVMAFG